MRLLIILVLLLIASGAHAQKELWSGTWEAHWQGGATYIELSQTGNSVTGRYPLLGGEIEGTADGRTLTGTWQDGDGSGSLIFRLSPDRQSFLGRFNNGEWWTGGRVARAVVRTRPDQATPRAVMRSFMLAGNRWRAGAPDEIGRAAAVLNFGDRRHDLTPARRLELADALFELADLTMLELWTIPEVPPEPELLLRLPQAGSEAGLPLHLRRDDAGKWWIVMPADGELAAERKALLEHYGGRVPPHDAFLRQRSPRDTMRSFIDAFRDWDRGGRAQALAALDLSSLPPAMRDEEGTLAALYIKHILDRVSLIIPQEIPDDSADRNPYVHFVHPAGRIAIAATSDGPATTWKFTADTVATARDIYAAIGSMPIVGGGVTRTPMTPFFAARHFVAIYAPWLLHRIGQLESWQALGAAVVLLIGFAAACLVAWPSLILCSIMLGEAGKEIRPRIAWPVRWALTAVVWQLAMPILGLPHAVRRISDPFSAVVLAFAGGWAAWHLVAAVGSRVSGHIAERQGSFDDVSVALAVVALRISVVIGGLLYVADAVDIPYSGIVAGLGISGLAVAFASKETLSNVFGAGILMIDRPFHRGDSIIAGDTRGTVEHVGIRSTRIRTTEDSLIVVPNGKLSDAMINNLGTRRHRLVVATLVIPYGVSPGKVDAFTRAVEELLTSHAKVARGRIRAGVKTLTQTGFELEVTFYLDVGSAVDETETRHALMLALARLAARLDVPLGEGFAAAEAAAPAAG